MQACKEWGLTPGAWRQQGVDDRARMMAHVWIESTREAYSAEARLVETEPKKDPKKGGGMAEFKRMREMMKPPPGWKPPEQ